MFLPFSFHNQHHRGITFLMGLLLFCCFLPGCSAQPAVSTTPPPIIMVGSTMGTTWKVTVPTLPQNITDEKLFAEIKQQLEIINGKMSTYLPNSEVSRFNQSQSTDWFPVSKETAIVITEAERISQLSNGAFDITVAPLVNLWNFGPEINQQLVPNADVIAKTKKKVGYKKLHVRLSPPAIKKEIALLQIDLSAIAKGYAVDEIAKLLEDRGIKNYLVDIGGEVSAKGTKQDGLLWRLGVEAPIASKRSSYKIIELTNHAIATSGDYRNFREINGKRYSHTLNPQTGYPVEHSLASASVILKSCMTADAFATTLMVLGPKEGLRFAKEQNLDVMLIQREGTELSDQMTNRFEQQIVHKNKSVSEGDKSRSSGMIFVITFIVFGIAMVGMAIGFLVKRKCLQGSCGGLSAMQDAQGKPLCESCSHPSPECEQLADQFEESNKS